MSNKEIENRIAALEQKVADLQAKLDATAEKKDHPNPFGPWWITTAGRFKDDPVFEEIVRLGREYRKSTLPDYMKKKRRTKRKTDRART
ncbi:MAG TPA: hypothetical protein VFE62_13340 [Gemmataceae bacterium]|nr:hypothetical protein [Gemmataceae bacterium]